MVATPATAATSTFASTTDIFVDDNVVTATNATPISIPDSGVASVYPSAITVTHNARISDLNVTLFDVSHTWPDDINVLLVGPHGQQVTLISDAGGGNDAGEDFVVDDLTFDDSAATPGARRGRAQPQQLPTHQLRRRRHLPGAGARPTPAARLSRTSTARSPREPGSCGCTTTKRRTTARSPAVGARLHACSPTPTPAPSRSVVCRRSATSTSVSRGSTPRRWTTSTCSSSDPRASSRTSSATPEASPSCPTSASPSTTRRPVRSLTAIRPSTAARTSRSTKATSSTSPTRPRCRSTAPCCRCSTASVPTASGSSGHRTTAAATR